MAATLPLQMSIAFEQGLARAKLERDAIPYLPTEFYRFVDFFELDRKCLLNADEQIGFLPQRHLEECEALAEGAEVTYKEVAAISFSSLLSRLFCSGCTSFLIPRSHERRLHDPAQEQGSGSQKNTPQCGNLLNLEGFKIFLGVTTAGNIIIWCQDVNENGLVVSRSNSPCEAVDPAKAQGMTLGRAIRRILEELHQSQPYWSGN